MKLFNIALIALLLVFCTCPFNETLKTDGNKTSGKEEIAESGLDKKEGDKLRNLFNFDSNGNQECSEKIVNIKDEHFDIPIPKRNPWKDFGKGDIAYFFDHLDFLLQKKLAAKFKKIYDTAKGQNSTIPDIYSEESLKLQFVQGRDFSQGFTPYIKNFNQDAWQKAITYPQAVSMIHKGKWFFEKHIDFSKISFDKFDFNGDGRLDMYEFILFSIIHNIPIYKKDRCKKETCYDDLFTDIIDPMFNFFDCEKTSKVTTEQIWNGLKKLKRPSSEKYSLFTCNLKLDFEKEYRTISVSDFILQAANKDRILDLQEFRTGILLGYWKRQVSPFEIIDGDKFNKKVSRWNSQGTEDLMCGKIKSFLPETWKNKAENKNLSDGLPGAKQSTSFLQESSA